MKRSYTITALHGILLSIFWVKKLFPHNRKRALQPDTSGRSARKVGWDYASGEWQSFQSFLSRTADTCKLAWFVNCTSFMSPFLTSVTLYPVFLWWVITFFSTYRTSELGTESTVLSARFLLTILHLHISSEKIS